MSTLMELGMRKNWLYEVVISSFDNRVPHAAPFGVKTRDLKSVAIEMYKGSNTLRNVFAGKDFALNTVSDPTAFYYALYKREKINFGRAKMIQAPVLTDSSASIEARLTNAENRKASILIEAEVVYVHIRNRSELINRAKGVFLESLIVATRIPYLPEGKAVEILKENYRVIKKTAPGSKYEDIMRELLDKCGM